MKVYIYRREDKLHQIRPKYKVFTTLDEDPSLSKLLYTDSMPKKKLTRKFVRYIPGRYTSTRVNLGVPLYESADGYVKNILITKYEI